MKYYQTPLEVALLAQSLGLSVLPPRENGSKAPISEPIPTSGATTPIVWQLASSAIGWAGRTGST